MTDPAAEQKIARARTRMAELALKFLDRSDDDIASMRAGLEKVGAGDAKAVGDIRHLAHRMVGTGATLGYAAVSVGAHAIERLTESCAPDQVPDAQWRSQVSGAIDALSGEIRKQRG